MRIVVTGAPGTGKTTLLELLATRNVSTVEEPARRLLRRSFDRYRDRAADFVDDLLTQAIQDWTAATPAALTIFDRGVADCVAYAIVSGVDPQPSREAALRCRYSPVVFIAPPWRRIYRNDELRTASFSDVVAFDAALTSAYAAAGYRLLHLPKSPVEERAEFMLDALAAQAHTSWATAALER